jgi:hypothetical protein
MKLQDLNSQWTQDEKIDISDLANEAARTYNLHAKYSTLLADEGVILGELKENMKRLELVKYRFYTEGPTKEQHADGQKLPSRGKIMKSEVVRWLEGDEDISKLARQIGRQVKKVEKLIAIMSMIQFRNKTLELIQRETQIRWENGELL